MSITFPDVVVALLLATATLVMTRCWLKGIREILNHQAGHYHIRMQNEEVARRWREQELAKIGQ